jgi:hypothetical protein
MGRHFAASQLIAVLATAPVPAAHAQSLLSGDEQNVVNFAFATQLGSGVYSVSGRTLQIYRLPFHRELKPATGSGMGVALTLPVTFGFYDFELQDVADGDIPTNVDAVSFVPGLTFVFRLRAGWLLEPYVEAGLSKARGAEADSTVYSGGLVSLYESGGRGFDWQLRNDLGYAGVELRGGGGSDHFTRFQTVLTARRSFARGSSLDYLVYALNDYYIDQPNGPVDSADSRGGSMQYELGFTLGTAETRRIWGVPLPRVGVGYRFGPDLEAWRIVFGTPY